MNAEVDFYFDKVQKWQEEIKKLRAIVLACKLNEELKWGVPCYTFQKKNIVLIHVFKEYCALLFFKGALMKDLNKILVQQTKQVQAARQIRFTNIVQIVDMESVLKNYVDNAVEIEKAGLKVELKKTEEFIMPEEFKDKLTNMPLLKTAFEKLTPGRQRGYLLYFAAPKQTKTRVSRIEKYIPQILNGKGLND